MKWRIAVALALGLAVAGAIFVLMPRAEPAPRPVTFGSVVAVVTAPDGSTRELCLLSAETPLQVQRGLMDVTDPRLGGHDGMLFTFPADTDTAFWMRNTPMPLSIAYLASTGQIVSTVDMRPCLDGADCPSYPPTGPYRYAVEVPQGKLPAIGLTPGARLTPGSRSCTR